MGSRKQQAKKLTLDLCWTGSGVTPMNDCGNIVCVKCGMIAISKCPLCRPVFLSNQTAAILSNIIDVHEKDKEVVVTIRRLKHEDESRLRVAETLEQLTKTLAGLTGLAEVPWLNRLTLKQFLCSHEWAWMLGESSRIGCGHKLSPLPKEPSPEVAMAVNWRIMDGNQPGAVRVLRNYATR